MIKKLSNNLKNGLTNKDYDWIDDNIDWIRDADRKRKLELNNMLGTDNAIVSSFPEELDTVMQVLIDSWLEADKLYEKLQNIWQAVDRTQTDSFTKWFYKRKTMFVEARDLLALQKRILRLERLKKVYEKKQIEKQLSKEYFNTKKEREQFDIDKMFARAELLADIASFYGLDLKKRGKLFRGKCPFHEEKTPSFFIYADNWFHCFGCQRHGNFIDYIMIIRNLSFREALEEANHYL